MNVFTPSPSGNINLSVSANDYINGFRNSNLVVTLHLWDPTLLAPVNYIGNFMVSITQSSQ